MKIGRTSWGNKSGPGDIWSEEVTFFEKSKNEVQNPGKEKLFFIPNCSSPSNFVFRNIWIGVITCLKVSLGKWVWGCHMEVETRYPSKQVLKKKKLFLLFPDRPQTARKRFYRIGCLCLHYFWSQSEKGVMKILSIYIFYPLFETFSLYVWDLLTRPVLKSSNSRRK